MPTIKNVIILVVSLTFSFHSYSQKYMDEIAKQACECLENVPDSLNSEEFTMKLGLCMIEVAQPYQKQLKKDYGIDFKNIDKHGEELGSIIGMKMVGFCPEALIKMANIVNEEKGSEEMVAEEKEELMYTGVITNVAVSPFVVFTVKNSEGKLSKFYWLTFVESNLELTTDYESFKGRLLMVSYEKQEFFDPRIGEYRMFNIINKMDLSEE